MKTIHALLICLGLIFIQNVYSTEENPVRLQEQQLYISPDGSSAHVRLDPSKKIPLSLPYSTSIRGFSINATRQCFNNSLGINYAYTFPNLKNFSYFDGCIEDIDLENLGHIPTLEYVLIQNVLYELTDDQLYSFSFLHNLRMLSIIYYTNSPEIIRSLEKTKAQLQKVLPNTLIDLQIRYVDPMDNWWG